MKTKEQILKWLDEQPWKGEFYEAVFTLRTDLDLDYDEAFILGAFRWGKTEQGRDVWSKRNSAYREWYFSNEKTRSWKEYCEQNPIKEDEYYIGNSSSSSRRCTTMPKDLCEAFLAYMKLMQLRNAWTKDWEALYCSYKVEAKDDIISSSPCSCFMYGLSFPTPEMADEFIKTFKDLLEVAKLLL